MPGSPQHNSSEQRYNSSESVLRRGMPVHMPSRRVAVLLLMPMRFLLPQQSAPPAQVSNYDPAIFQKPIPADQLAFLNQFDGAPSGDLVRDKQFRKLMHSVIPDCMFHYG